MKLIVVEDCEIVKVADRSRCSELGFEFATLPTRGEVSAFAYSAPVVAIRVFKLYRPSHLQTFACRACHNLTYTSVQKHDARLDRLLKLPDYELRGLVAQNKNIR